MTKWADFPLRPQNQPWPGLNTRGGRLGDGSGQLEDGSVNVIINESDLLEKRKGLTRGLDERFGTAVCGLFTYTDHCGTEWLLVADDEDGISIRQPFTIPVFTSSDAYPNDEFDQDDGTSLNSENWRNATRYQVRNDKMVLVPGTPASAAGAANRPANMARWFKDSASKSYRCRVDYDFDNRAVKQVVSVMVRGSTGNAAIFGTMEFIQGGDYVARLYHRDDAGNLELMMTVPVTGQLSGFFTVLYDFTEKKPGLAISVTGGTILEETLSTDALTELEDIDLGLRTGIGLDTVGGTVTQTFGIETVVSGPL